jgi:hypothetical protein
VLAQLAQQPALSAQLDAALAVLAAVAGQGGQIGDDVGAALGAALASGAPLTGRLFEAVGRLPSVTAAAAARLGSAALALANPPFPPAPPPGKAQERVAPPGGGVGVANVPESTTVAPHPTTPLAQAMANSPETAGILKGAAALAKPTAVRRGVPVKV